MLTRSRFLLTLGAVLLAGVVTTPTEAARAQPGDQPVNGRFFGEVIAVAGRAVSPTGFTLQARDRTIDFRIVPRTNFLARSAEAQVANFCTYTFAVVTATRASGDWVATRVEYDVVPFGPIRDFPVSGRITWVDRPQHTMRLKTLSGDVHAVRINRRTKFTIDSQPVDVAPVLVAGNQVDAMVHRTIDEQWIAVSVNVRSATAGR